MSGQDVLGTLGTVIDADLTRVDRDRLAALVRLISESRACIDAFEIRVAALANELSATGACESAVALLAGDGRRSARQAETAARRAKLCAQLPALEQALAAGRISGEHVDAVADVARTLNDSGQADLRDLDETLAKSAAVSSVDAFARECRDLGRIPRCPEVSVLIDIETLRDGLHDDTVCETSDGVPLPPDAVRRMACDAEIVPVVLGADGEALDAGRGKRLATRAQRRALNSMYSTCAFPGCTVAFEACRIHHVVPWEHGGLTDLDNLIPLCEREHHHLVHEGHWQLTLQADRTITIHRPDGTLFFEGNTTNRRPRHQAA